MPHVPYVRLEEATGTAREALETWDREQGKRSLILESMANHPPLLDGFWAFVKGALVEGNLDRELKELVAVAVSQTNDCDYCTSSHRESFERVFELPRAKLEAVSAGDFSTLYERERAAAEYGIAVAEDAHRIGPKNVTSLRKAGFSEEDVVELTGLVSCFMAANTYVDAMGIHPSDRDNALTEYLEL